MTLAWLWHSTSSSAKYAFPTFLQRSGSEGGAGQQGTPRTPPSGGAAAGKGGAEGSLCRQPQPPQALWAGAKMLD